MAHFSSPTIISAKKEKKKNKWCHIGVCIFKKWIAGSCALAKLQTTMQYRFIFMTWTDVIKVLKKKSTVSKCQLLLNTQVYNFLERLFSWMLEMKDWKP